MYYNTTNTTGDTLKTYKAKANSQEKKVLDIFNDLKTDLSADMVWGLMDDEAPLTSIRRAITDLENEGKLQMTGKKTMGLYGREVNTWRLIKD